jgi:ribosomal protein L40E
MDPLVIYTALIFGALLLLLAATAFARKPSRACMQCSRQTPIDGRRCRHCGYRQSRV